MYIVQLTDNYEFLYPHPDGDVCTTPFLRQAGVFQSAEAAIETAEFYSGVGSFHLVDIYNFEVSK